MWATLVARMAPSLFIPANSFVAVGAEGSLYRYQDTIYIDRPHQEVWDFVSNPANHEKWTKDEPLQWTSEGPPGVGSTIRGAAKVLGRTVESPTVITAWEPPNVYARKSLGGKIESESRIELPPKESGTELAIVAQAQIGGFFRRVAGLVKEAIPNAKKL